ncbi:MAG TPA: hypothetical protein VFC19_48065 [Candidatus Limnocylindrales bacterium]|nr:hypothetical protein [Candidatus Limnocylindrales bacterium]
MDRQQGREHQQASGCDSRLPLTVEISGGRRIDRERGSTTTSTRSPGWYRSSYSVSIPAIALPSGPLNS